MVATRRTPSTENAAPPSPPTQSSVRRESSARRAIPRPPPPTPTPAADASADATTTASGGSVKIDEAYVVQADIEASNGGASVSISGT
jgi:hypothetical protein